MNKPVNIGESLQLVGPCTGALSVTPSDLEDLPVSAPVRSLWVGTTGNLTVTMLNGDTVTLVAVVGGLPISVKKIWETGTTASDIVAFV